MSQVRKILAWLSVPVVCLVMMLLYLLRPFNPDNNRILGWVVARVGRCILGMKRPLYGAENMPKDRPTVIIANHQQNDDLFVMGDLLPPRGVAVGKSSLVWVPFFGQVFWLGGNIILNRGRAAKAVATMQATSDAINGNARASGCFRREPTAVAVAWVTKRRGVSHGRAAGAPITMVCAGEYHGKSRGWTGRREPVPLRILPPVETQGMTSEDIPELMHRCRQQMEEAIADCLPWNCLNSQ